MWIVFGLVALCVSVLAAWIIRQESLWAGTRIFGDHEWGIDSAGKELSRVRIAVEAPGDLNICLHPERERDRVAKALGISVEHQVGHDIFDQRIYLQTDDERFTRMLAHRDDIREQLLTLFNWDSHGITTRVQQVRLLSGRLRVDIHCSNSVADQVKDSAIRELVPRLKEIAGAIEIATRSEPQSRDVFAWRAGALLALSSGITATAVLEAMTYGFFGSGRVLDTHHLLGIALPAGLIATVVLVALTFLLLGRTSRTHIVLAELLTLGLAGCLLLAWFKVEECNETFDRSPVSVVSATVTDTFKRRSRRMPDRYYVRLASDDPEVDGEAVRVSHHTYLYADRGQHWRLEKRAGALGIAWLQAYGPGVVAEDEGKNDY